VLVNCTKKNLAILGLKPCRQITSESRSPTKPARGGKKIQHKIKLSLKVVERRKKKKYLE
jgi:hypothetical protein